MCVISFISFAFIDNVATRYYDITYRHVHRCNTNMQPGQNKASPPLEACCAFVVDCCPKKLNAVLDSGCDWLCCDEEARAAAKGLPDGAPLEAASTAGQHVTIT